MDKQKVLLYFYVITFCFFICNISYGKDYIVSKSFSIEKGLPHSDVSAIVQDNYGFIWLGTPNGLCRYDGKELLSINEFEDEEWDILRGVRISDMSFSQDSLLYVSCYGIGLVSVNLAKLDITTYLKDVNGRHLPDINKIYHTNSGTMYLCSDKGLYLMNNGTIVKTLFQYASYGIIEMPNGELVILSGNGVYRYNISDGIIQEILSGSFSEIEEFNQEIICIGGASGLYLVDVKNKQSKLITDEWITSIEKDCFDNFWVGTKKRGIKLYDTSFNLVRIYETSSIFKKYRLNNDLVNTLYADNLGNIWAGTMDGLSQITHNVNDFQLFDRLSYYYIGDRIKGIYEYDNHIVISTLDGDLDMWDKSFSEMVSLSDYTDNLVRDITIIKQASDGSLLLGGEGGISVIRKQKITAFIKKRYRIKAETFGTSFLFNSHVNVIEEDEETGLWVGTNRGLFNVNSNGKFLHFPYRIEDEKHVKKYFDNFFITSLLVSSSESEPKKRVWIGTRTGLKYIDYFAGSFNVVDYSNTTSDLYFKNTITSIIENSTGGIAMLSISDGLKIISSKDKWADTFVEGSIRNGLMNNIYETLIEDNIGNYWIGGIGLLRWDPRKNSFRYYSTSDGIINRSFKVRSSYKLKSGMIMMAGLNSVDIFNPVDIKDYTYINANAVFTHLKISGIDIIPGKRFKGKDILPKVINEVHSVTLSYDHNDISISFKVLDYRENHYYKYKLVGQDDDYVYCSEINNKALYSNVPPGRYRFVVYYTDNNYIWNNKPLTLDILIRPPFYKTILAYAIYLLLLGGVLYSSLRYYQRRLKQKNAILLAEAIHKEEKKINELKLKFFADISHEIKTPLTLIYSPLMEICGDKLDDQEKVKTKLTIAMKNAERLKLLAESLIDMEQQSINYTNLAVSKVDVVAFCKEVVSLFQDLAYSQNIDYSFFCAEDIIWGYFDAIKIEKVIFNLISNAFKYTPSGGYVKVGVEDDRSYFSIYVEDSGVGISEVNKKKIFERYFRVLNTEKPGAGIGLAMSETIIKNHNGLLEVQSEEGKGSRFTVKLKKGFEHYKDINIIDTYPLDFYMGKNLEVGETNCVYYDERIHLLVVDDNDQMREYLKEALGKFYTVYAANNGEEALEIAANTELDMVLSDVVMPNLDGFQLCEKLKSNIKTSHIPVLLISAQGQSYMKIKGYASKADAFIEKPFNIKVLQAKIRNVLEQRKEWMKSFNAYINDNVINENTSIISDIDKEFMESIVSIIENNMINTEFGVDALANEIGMSRPVLYRKIKALSGMSIVEFVRHIKLHKAEEMLKSGRYNVSEVMYMVGFNSMSYFSKAFKKEFGCLPKSSMNKQ